MTAGHRWLLGGLIGLVAGAVVVTGGLVLAGHGPFSGGSAAAGPGTAHAGPCPPSFAQLTSANGPTRGRPGPASLGLPGHPRSALVCVYSTLNASPPLGLRWSRALNTSKAESLLSVVNATTTTIAATAATNCPADNGSGAILQFVYSAGPTQQLLVHLSGCQIASSYKGNTMSRHDITRAVQELHP